MNYMKSFLLSDRKDTNIAKSMSMKIARKETLLFM